MSAVVGHIDCQRFVLRFFVPGEKVASHHLVSQATFYLKLEFYRIAVFRVDPLERELMEKITVLGRQNTFYGGLTVDDDLRRAANVRRAFFGGEEQCTQRHDRGLRRAPGSCCIFLPRNITYGLAPRA